MSFALVTASAALNTNASCSPQMKWKDLLARMLKNTRVFWDWAILWSMVSFRTGRTWKPSGGRSLKTLMSILENTLSFLQNLPITLSETESERRRCSLRTSRYPSFSSIRPACWVCTLADWLQESCSTSAMAAATPAPSMKVFQSRTLREELIWEEEISLTTSPYSYNVQVTHSARRRSSRSWGRSRRCTVTLRSKLERPAKTTMQICLLQISWVRERVESTVEWTVKMMELDRTMQMTLFSLMVLRSTLAMRIRVGRLRSFSDHLL